MPKQAATQDYLLPSTSFYRSEKVVVEHLSMRKVRELLRAKFDAGLSVRKIATSLCAVPAITQTGSTPAGCPNGVERSVKAL